MKPAFQSNGKKPQMTNLQPQNQQKPQIENLDVLLFGTGRTRNNPKSKPKSPPPQHEKKSNLPRR
jgi:hypothetical protein